jgi:hypothetical protein
LFSLVDIRYRLLRIVLGPSRKIANPATRGFILWLPPMPASPVFVIVQRMLTNAPRDRGFICLACGCELPEPLRRTASLRCHDCRALNAPLHVEHARRARAFGFKSAA